jgi:chaperonin GroES
MSLNVRPLYDRVLVKRLAGEEKSAGGIIIPDNAKEKPLEGEVVATGKGKVLDDGSVREVQVKVGDKVLFAKYAETEIKIEGQNYLLLREDDLLAVMG